MISGTAYQVDDPGTSSVNPLTFTEATSNSLTIGIVTSSTTTSQSSVTY
mgnify:CR=1 FL=1